MYKINPFLFLKFFTSFYKFLQVFTSFYMYLYVFTCIYMYLHVFTSFYMYSHFCVDMNCTCPTATGSPVPAAEDGQPQAARSPAARHPHGPHPNRRAHPRPPAAQDLQRQEVPERRHRLLLADAQLRRRPVRARHHAHHPRQVKSVQFA